METINTEEDYELALEQMSRVFQAKKNTPEGDALEVLALRIADYESRRYSARNLSRIEALKTEMEVQGLTHADLAERMGISEEVVSDIINEKKEMTMRFLRFMYKDLGISDEILMP